MGSGPAVRVEDQDGVRSIVLCRPESYNTITPQMRDELGAAIDEADRDRSVKVMLLRAEGPAFCTGYGLDWATARPPTREGAQAPARHWDSAADFQMMSRFVDTYRKLWYASKPSVAMVHGWCICGGTDLVLWSDIIIAGESAVFGYPPARVWGIPTAAQWVLRIGFEKAKRYLLTGDELPAPEAARIGLILEAVPDDDLLDRATSMASRMAKLPLNQLQMIKLYCNQQAQNMGMDSTRALGILLDGIARNTAEGEEFVRLSNEVGFREAVRRRDDPFSDYGSGPRSKRREG